MAMSKRTIYTIFIAKFVFSLAMIFWTIKMTLGAGVGKDDDNTFMSYYHDVDKNYNEIVLSNHKFESMYDIKLQINNFELNSLDYKDIYLSQRVIDKRLERKNILKLGSNDIRVNVFDKTTGEIVKNVKTNIVFTISSSHDFDQDITIESNATTKIEITKKTYWNIMGTVNVDGLDGRFYIKTNAI